jgi:predicted CXXCH cytochrome family protein
LGFVVAREPVSVTVMQRSLSARIACRLGATAVLLLALSMPVRGEAPAGMPQQNLVHSAPIYVGSSACIECHAEAGKAWQGSQHAMAMQPATDKTVLGNFMGRALRHGKSNTRYARRGDSFRITTEGADGRSQELEVTHTFGIFPLQQYLVSLPDGRKQALGVAWDSRDRNAGGGRWFHLFPGEGTRPGHAQHWSGIDQNWNYQCADCHSTNLRKGYDARTDRFDTTWSEISVGCEACHGPGSTHQAWAATPAGERPPLADHGLSARLDERAGVAWVDGAASGTRIRARPRSTTTEIEVCARCHARRGQISDEHPAGAPLLNAFRPALIEPGLYYPDGQQRDEVFTYGSFLQSRMHAAGVSCSDCHEPHGGKLRVGGNAVCAQCHDPARFDKAEHHHHAPGGVGAQCTACHMPPTSYMGVDPRHDHSLRIPRPDRSLALGTPNACNQCHTGKSVKWAADAFRRWGPSPKPGFQDFAEAFHAADAGLPDAARGLVTVVRDANQSGIARASAVAKLRPYLSRTTLPVVAGSLADRDDQVRLAAVAALSAIDPGLRARFLAPLLKDPRRVIRIEAARALAGPGERHLDATDQPAFAAALNELFAAESFNADRPEAHVRLGDLHAARADRSAAEREYRLALARDPTHLATWSNLAALMQASDRADEATQLLRDGLRAKPGAAELQHALGLALIRAGDRKQALQLLGAAAQGAPANPRFAFVHAVARHDTGDLQGALRSLRAALKRHPHERDLAQALDDYRRESAAAQRAIHQKPEPPR